MNKNPFSIYDSMGYLFPGVLCSVFIYLAFHFEGDMSKLTDVAQLKIALSNTSTGFDLDKSIMFIVFSYLLGHIVSYMSSQTIEQFAIKVFDYPSVYLLEERQMDYGQLWKNYFYTQDNSSCNIHRKAKIIFKFILKLIIFILVFPISLSVFTFGYFCGLNDWVVRNLDKFLIDAIKTKQYILANRLDISHPDVNDKKCDYHRIIQHYVYLNIPNSQKKTDNYIALYGFLRCISLIFAIVFDVVFVNSLMAIDTNTELNPWLCILLVSLYFISYLTFLGFMKFYRRFTLENYMTLLSGMFDTSKSMNHI